MLIFSVFTFSKPPFHCGFKNRIITALGILFMLTLDITINFNTINAEYFSSVDKLATLKDIELGYVKALQDYLVAREKELESFSKYIQHIKIEHKLAAQDTEDFLGNPINAFTLINRMVNDWKHVHELMNRSQAIDNFRQTFQNLNRTHPIPDIGELKGAAKGLARLQRVYKINEIDLANGHVNGTNFGTKLFWHDCFEIALNLYEEKDFEFALKWLKVTLKKLEKYEGFLPDVISQKFRVETLEYLALINYELGDVHDATHYIELLLKLQPNHSIKNVRNYMLNSQPQATLLNKHEAWYDNYTRLCRGEQIPERKLKSLVCQLDTRGSPHFLLAPLKVEQISTDPDISLYHGLLNDVQISKIIAEAREQKMFRSLVKKVYGKPDSENIVSDERVSQQVWLQFHSPIMRFVHNLVADITGLDMYNAEYMQVANYGIGGQYEPHTDFFGPACFREGRWLGDRVVTTMFYLSNVELGGFTVFPRINIYARPVKGALIVWYNLHRSLDGDHRMQHAGCPIIKGSKRIGNIWVHAQHQEFRRPCLLESDTEKSAAYKPQT